MEMENVRLLLNAVVEQAAWDYIDALCKKHKAEFKKNIELDFIRLRQLENEIKLCESEINQLESFFTSEDFSGYSKIDGNWFMKKLKKLVAECDYDSKEITKRRQLNKEEWAS